MNEKTGGQTSTHRQRRCSVHVHAMISDLPSKLHQLAIIVENDCIYPPPPLPPRLSSLIIEFHELWKASDSFSTTLAKGCLEGTLRNERTNRATPRMVHTKSKNFQRRECIQTRVQHRDLLRGASRRMASDNEEWHQRGTANNSKNTAPGD
jgi:hypothetical protein